MTKYRWWIVAAVVLALVTFGGLNSELSWPEIAWGFVLFFVPIRLVFWLLSKVVDFGKSAVRTLTGSAPKS